MMNNIIIPTFDQMMVPTLQALQELGGSGTITEIYEKVADIMQLSPELLTIPHGKSNRGEIAYRLAWSRTYLKKYGMLEAGDKRGVWSLNATPNEIAQVNTREVVKSVNKAGRQKALPEKPRSDNEELLIIDEVKEDILPTWQEQLHQILLGLTPERFEHLAQRLLRESGFTQVDVTGRSGDGGIDGIGIARIAGFLSFQVLFQCKRYQGSISPSQIRDFRGAMQGRTDKGLFITTGTFTREAIKEATRDGAPPIDLIDGEQLVNRLRELNLGVKIEMVERVEINEEWFTKL